jgi:hypothetical protein
MSGYKKCGKCPSQVPDVHAVIVNDPDVGDVCFCGWVCAAAYCLSQEMAITSVQ